MKEYIDALRRLCTGDHENEAPYLLRTRFERNMYGLLVTFSERSFGRRPSGMTEDHIRECVARCAGNCDDAEVSIALSMARLFERFTYLCDTSNWSNDGQDPRIEMCRKDIMNLSDLMERRITEQGPHKHKN